MWETEFQHQHKSGYFSIFKIYTFFNFLEHFWRKITKYQLLGAPVLLPNYEAKRSSIEKSRVELAPVSSLEQVPKSTGLQPLSKGLTVLIFETVSGVSVTRITTLLFGQFLDQ